MFLVIEKSKKKISKDFCFSNLVRYSIFNVSKGKNIRKGVLDSNHNRDNLLYCT